MLNTRIESGGAVLPQHPFMVFAPVAGKEGQRII